MTGKHNAPEFQEQLDVRINGEGRTFFLYHVNQHMKILLLAKFLTLCELHSGPLKFIDDVYIYFF